MFQRSPLVYVHIYVSTRTLIYTRFCLSGYNPAPFAKEKKFFFYSYNFVFFFKTKSSRFPS